MVLLIVLIAAELEERIRLHTSLHVVRDLDFFFK